MSYYAYLQNQQRVTVNSRESLMHGSYPVYAESPKTKQKRTKHKRKARSKSR